MTKPDDEKRERLITKMETVIPHLDNPEWKQEYGPQLESVEESQRRLAQDYYNWSNGVIKGTFVLLVGLLFTDFLIYTHKQLYGLSINIWSSMFIIYPSLKGRYMIAGLSESISEEAVREVESENSVFANLGFALLIFGFVLQIISLQVVQGDELVQQNLLSQWLPAWTALIFIFCCFAAVFVYFSNN